MAANVTGVTLSEAFTRPSVFFSVLVLCLLIILIIAGNITVLRTVYVTSRFHYSTYYYLASLAFADLLVGLTVAPFAAAYRVSYEMSGEWVFGGAVCGFWVTTTILCGCASVLNLCVVSWDRYVTVTSPLNYTRRMYTNVAKAIIPIVWVTSSVIAIPLGRVVESSRAHKMCNYEGLTLGYAVTAFVLLYGFPVLFLFFVNGSIIRTARSHLKRIHDQEMAASRITIATECMTTQVPKQRPTRFSREMRIFKACLIVIAAFLCCWTGFFVVLLITPLSSPPAHYVGFSTLMLTYGNSACNPYLYGLLNGEFKRAVRRSLPSFKSRIRPFQVPRNSVSFVSRRASVLSPSPKHSDYSGRPTSGQVGLPYSGNTLAPYHDM